ncbi:unnamed protein product [Allacma fusca]|uniref:CRAL-TRIO domain-containing protein n=1 Tax=Allacma fusca TaxID=39272 RepID=A0A8J2K5Q4_9HEXA|nr:unnamed protein product [Allacma fusca]
MSIWMARQFEQAFSNHMKVAYIVNANFVFTTVWNMMKPILGQNVYKVDIFGSNKDQWVPVLLKHFPRDQLSKRYGGTRHFKPVQVYG